MTHGTKNEKLKLLLRQAFTPIHHVCYLCRLKTIEILCNFFRSVIALSSDDLLNCVYLCLNKLAPAYEGMELGIGETVLMKAIAQATGMWILIVYKIYFVSFKQPRGDFFSPDLGKRILKSFLCIDAGFNHSRCCIYQI